MTQPQSEIKDEMSKVSQKLSRSRNDDPLQERLNHLASKAAEAQNDENYEQALEYLTESLDLQVDAYGQSALEVQETFKQLSDVCNVIAMNLLQSNELEKSHNYLRKALNYSKYSNACRIVCYNNLATYYRAVNKPKSAQDILEKALKEQASVNMNLKSDTLLNLCALHSSQKNHNEALKSALRAVVLLQQEILDYLPSQKSTPRNLIDAVKEEFRVERLATLAIALHNAAVEFEYLGRLKEALILYRQSLTFAQTHLPAEHQLVFQLKFVVKAASETITNNQKPQKTRPISRRVREKVAGLNVYGSIPSRKFVTHPKGKGQPERLPGKSSEEIQGFKSMKGSDLSERQYDKIG